jgi:hypothetical protein
VVWAAVLAPRSIVLVDRGKVSFYEKAMRAQEAGAAACVFVNSSDEPFVAFGGSGEDTNAIKIPCCCIGSSDGQWLAKKAVLITLAFEPHAGWDVSRASAASTASSTDGSLALEAESPTASIDVTYARAKHTYASDVERDLTFVKGTGPV